MPSIFKNIRRKLASENKTAAYLRYAVGEIFLVVIGILIALQVNTWRGQYVEHRKELSTLTLLMNDLKDDRVDMKEFVEKLTEQNDDLVSLFNKINTDVPVDTLVGLTVRGTRIWNYRHSSPTYTGLKQSGSMDIIRDEQLRNKILRYHDYMMTYLENLVNDYQHSQKEARLALRPYLDVRPDDKGEWVYTSNDVFLKIKNDHKTLNTVADYGVGIHWLKIRLSTVFIPENDTLQNEIQAYINKIN